MIRLLLLFVALLPLAVDFSGLRPFEPIKIHLLETAIALATLVAAIAVLFRRKQFLNRLSGIHWLDVWVVILFTTQAIGTVFSINPAISFWGSAERGTGLVFMASVTTLYFLVRFLATRDDWIWFSGATLVTVSAVSLYAILQAIHRDVPQFVDAFLLYGAHGPARAFATLGHPNFLGAYLAMALPFGILFWNAFPKRSYRIVVSIASALGIVALLLTYSRGAWAGFFVGGFVTVILLRHSAWKKMLTAGGAVVLGLIFLSFVISSSAPLLARIGSTFDTTNGSTKARLDEWRYAPKLLPQRLITGFGPGTYGEFSEDRQKDPGSDPSYADRLHNLFLDTLWNSGLIGLIALLGVLGAAILRLHVLLKENRMCAAPFAGVLASYIVLTQVSFDFSISSALFFIALAGLSLNKTTRV
ncbi:MAG: O-antigen ligase family protein [bacterium]|nr:O-antigen ligase family protein [bacterium]